MFWVALSAAAAIAGVLFLRRGIVGRAIDDHPICARCSFDLLGLGQTHARCPECGSTLSERGRVRTGNRRRRPKSIGLGAFLLFLGALVFSAWLAGERGAIVWESYKPVWMLKHELRADWTVRREAAGELERRSSCGKLSSESLGSLLRDLRPLCESQDQGLGELHQLLGALMDDPLLPASDHDATLRWILQVQRDPSKPWSQALGECVESAFLRGQLDDATFRLYMDQAFDPHLVLLGAGHAGRGEEVPVLVACSWRAGSIPFSTSLHLDGLCVQAGPSTDVICAIGPTRTAPIGTITAGNTPGKQTLSGTVSLCLDSTLATSYSGMRPILAKSTISLRGLASYKISKPVHADLAVTNESVAEFKPEQQAISRLTKALYVSDLGGSGDRLGGSVSCRHTGHDFDFDFELILSVLGTPESLGTGVLSAHTMTSGYSFRSNSGSSMNGSSSGGGESRVSFDGRSRTAVPGVVDIVIRVTHLQVDGVQIPLDAPLDVTLPNLPVTR